MRRATTITIPAGHPAFAGHFPGAPIVPGVVLLDEALVAIAAAEGVPLATCRIAAAKFFHPAGPGAMLVISHERQASGAIAFDIVEGARKVASGSVVLPGASGQGAGA